MDFHISLIEDDSSQQKLFRVMLEKSFPDATIRISKCLKDGLADITAKRPDIILCDLHLPDAKDMQPFEILKEIFPSIPALALTASDSPDIAAEAIRAGAQDFLFKADLTKSILAQTIKNAIERHRLRMELEETNQKLNALIRIDPLTNLLNRRGLSEMLLFENEKSKRYGTKTQVFLIDIDDFKIINDKLGYNIGDIVIQNVAKNICECTRTTDHVGRVGGDEFIVILPETNDAQAFMIAQKIRLAIFDHVNALIQTESLKISVSIGVVELLGDFMSVDKIFEKSQSSLRQSKSRGKNIVTRKLSSAKEVEHLTTVQEITHDLALGNGIFALAQPIVNLQDLTVVAYEMLSRFTIKDLENPDDFFRFSMENNILAAVDHWCFKKCIMSSESLDSDCLIHINLFPSTIMHDGFESLTLEIPEKRRSRICIEINERQILGDPSLLSKKLNSIKKQGVKIAIDDVGFGNSSLENLILIEPDIVKIDRRCVKNLGQKDDHSARALKKILTIIDGCRAQSIVEGVETEIQREILLEMGVKKAQGFLLGRPGKYYEG